MGFIFSIYFYHIFHFSLTGVGLDAFAPDGKEYLFNCRPEHQVEISQQRLNNWYETLFKEAEQRGMVYDVMYGDRYGSPDKNQIRRVRFYYSIYFWYIPLQPHQYVL